MSVKELLALDKLSRLFQVVKHNGGIIDSIKKLYRMDTVKMGTLIGEDKFGNKYYENNEYMHAANRWVEYSDRAYLDYDAGQISPEWHAWLHYMTDIPPTKANYPKHKWMIQEPMENLTGTKYQYVPYSTTRQKISYWKPDGSKQ